MSFCTEPHPMSTAKDLTEHFQNGGWLPVSDEARRTLLKSTGLAFQYRPTKMDLLPAVADLKSFIENDATVLMGFSEMIRKAHIAGVRISLLFCVY